MRFLAAAAALWAVSLAGQNITPSATPNADPGRASFENRCARCHGAQAEGGERGPAIANRLAQRNDAQMIAIIREGLPGTGMPATQIPDQELTALTRYLRTLQTRAASDAAAWATIKTTAGKTLDVQIINRGFEDYQLRDRTDRIHLVRKAGDGYREVTSEVDWPGYNGDPGGNRYTKLAQITPANVAQIGARWQFTLPGTARLQGTPVVVEGVMYVTAENECYALDAGTGRPIWHYQRPRMQGYVAANANGTNRGVAVAGDRVFMATDHAHLIALNRFNGQLQWETQMADWRENYFATSAPLVAGNLVISGVSGGEAGAPGFVAAFDQTTGRETWRFNTVPKPGEPKSETWQGKGIQHGGAPTWFTGTYDAGLDTIYWPTGNPSAEYNGDDRGGDNLYSDCVLALDAKTGKLKWYYQFTPHDVWDYDATETLVVLDVNWQGQPRKLLVQANRNGFFYVFDRTDGKLLAATPFVRNLTWASGIGKDGRPVRNPNQEPSAQGTKICPSQDGATNWFSPSFDPGTGLFYIQTFEKCSVYTKRDAGEWEAGKQYLGGSQQAVAGEGPPTRVLKALDLKTGEIRWQLPQPGPATSWGGTLAAASGLVFFGEESGAFMAADGATGKMLWSFETNQLWKASPMTYQFDGKQYVAVEAGSNILAFGLPE